MPVSAEMKIGFEATLKARWLLSMMDTVLDCCGFLMVML